MNSKTINAIFYKSIANIIYSYCENPAKKTKKNKKKINNEMENFIYCCGDTSTEQKKYIFFKELQTTKLYKNIGECRTNRALEELGRMYNFYKRKKRYTPNNVYDKIKNTYKKINYPEIMEYIHYKKNEELTKEYEILYCGSSLYRILETLKENKKHKKIIKIIKKNRGEDRIRHILNDKIELNHAIIYGEEDSDSDSDSE